MADEEYFDDEEFEEEEDFEEFDEDFEAAGAAETKVKCVSGMDTFAVVWSFFATLIALCILSWVILYEVYDERLGGILPEKEKPLMQSKIQVLSFGRDADVSDTYNYAIIKAGKADEVVPGTVVLIGDPDGPSTVKNPAEAWVTLVVTEECEVGISRAMIVNVTPPAMGGGESQPVSVGGVGNLERRADDWSQIDNLTEAVEKLPLLLKIAEGGGEGDGVGKSTTIASTASWKEQSIIRWVEEEFGNHVRKEKGKSSSK